jgi:FkbM family methyltransferase
MGQAGQDYWVIGEVFDEKRGGYFVDVGAHDGLELSNTFLLEKRYGWNGVCVEANPETFERLTANRSAECVNACLADKPGTVQFSMNAMHSGIVGVTDEELGEVVNVEAQTLDNVLEACNAPSRIDYLSVDVEGAEDQVFAGFDLESRDVTCLTVERPSDDLRKRLDAAGYLAIKEIPGLDVFFLHKSHEEAYLQNVFSFYKKRHVALRWK